MRDLGPTSAGRKALLVASRDAERAAEHCGGGPKLPSAAEFGSFGRVSPTPAQLHNVSLSLEAGLIKPRARPHTRWRTPTALESGRKRPGHKVPSPSLTTPKLVVPVPSSQEKMSPKPDGLPSNKPSTGVYF
ncbi:hypothetical protein PGT21_018219 [Puccinia graminis f. sp. tritici]|uniref:Uncharacterized protein n=1 Tax=Puccinia graminis f. sp. tritici TaxID=56615 RepID=A0A5B0P857_PUCGR|nr:hypothetical protein PGT21_018219 [Puccinia graminis f. sp. tritici]KAA1126048.1 hypothetical protein PGTUg99_017199 [Puccinia graminis f. sp. tritici]